MTILLGRIEKYLDRYELTLSNKTKSFLFEQKKWLEGRRFLSFNIETDQEETVLDYYGRPITSQPYSTSDCLYAINFLLKLATYDGFLNQESFL